MATPVLELTDVAVNYGQVPALRGVDLIVNDGEFIVLLGPNGAGKTTTLRAISGLAKLKNGSIRFNGRALPRSASAVTRGGVAHVPEGRKIFPDHTVLENLQLGAYKLRRRRTERDASIDAMFELFPRLRERRDQQAGTLSGGEAQMLACARALAQLITVLKRGGLTIVVIEHNVGFVMSISDRVTVMEQGRVIAVGTPAEIQQHDEVQRAYLGDGDVIAMLGA